MPAITADQAQAEQPERVLTMNGNPIPPEVAHLIPFRNTDQGIEEYNRTRLVSDVRVSVRGGDFERKLERMEDGDAAYLETNPFQEKFDELAKQHPGMRFRAIGDKVAKRRGMRGWKPIISDNGDPVKVADMVIGMMPKREAARRSETYRRLGEEALQDAQDKYRESQEKHIHDGGKSGLGVLAPGEVLRDTEYPNRVAVTGFTHQCGLGSDD